jgi:hypothetical protein
MTDRLVVVLEGGPAGERTVETFGHPSEIHVPLGHVWRRSNSVDEHGRPIYRYVPTPAAFTHQEETE